VHEIRRAAAVNPTLGVHPLVGRSHSERHGVRLSSTSRTRTLPESSISD
jgi:plasmid stabilization system protein ParE